MNEYCKDLQHIKFVLDGLASDLPFCNAMSILLGKIFKCNYVYIFIYNERWNRLIERVIRTSSELPLIKFDPSIIGPELVRLAFRKPYFLDLQSKKSIGLGPNSSVIVAPTGDNQFLRGAIAIAKDSETAWDENDLEQLSIIVMLIIRCYELSMSLADNKRYANTIVDSVDTAIFAISIDGVMIHFNRAAEKVYGFPASLAIGKHYTDLLSPKEKEMTKRTLEYVMKSGKSWEGRFIEFTRVDNKVIFINLLIYPWLNAEGNIIGAIVLANDETENKNFQDKLVRVEKMAILGQIAVQVSQELRSPLASIREFARIIQKSERSGSTYKDYASTIIEQVNRINTVVEELLDFSQPEVIIYQRIDINRVLERAIDVSQIDRTKIVVLENYNENLFIDGDPQKIERVFINLLNNAYQSFEGEESGLIDIYTFKSPDNRVIIRIEDNGCGISEKDINKIFDPYFTNKNFGTGLGLAIVQQIVNSHGGTIKVTSNIGLGTCFEIEFPLGSEKIND